MMTNQTWIWSLIEKRGGTIQKKGEKCFYYWLKTNESQAGSRAAKKEIPHKVNIIYWAYQYHCLIVKALLDLPPFQTV